MRMDKTARQEVLELAMKKACDGRSRVLDTHTFHSFPARMPLKVAQALIQRMTRKRDVVLDPMCGSGTTLIAASSIGRTGLGFDLDPLAVLISTTAVAAGSGDHLLAAGLRLLERAKKRFKRIKSPTDVLPLSAETKMFVAYWFPKRSQRQLAALAEVIQTIADDRARDFFWTVFSSTIVVKSAGPSYALDLARSRPHRQLEKNVVFPFDAWELKLRRAIQCKAKVLPTALAKIETGDARQLPLAAECVDFILTSPPYLHAVDYVRAHKFALVWMGADIESLRELRANLIGSERGMFQLDGLPSSMERRLQGAQRSSVARSRRYLSDMFRSLKEAHRVLRPGGAAVFVVGDSVLSAERRDSANIMRQLGLASGFTACCVAARSLADQRRSLPPPQLFGNSLSKRMQEECFVGFLKE